MLNNAPAHDILCVVHGPTLGVCIEVQGWAGPIFDEVGEAEAIQALLNRLFRVHTGVDVYQGVHA